MIINYNKKLIEKALKETTDLLVLPEAVFPVFLELYKDLYDYLLNVSYKKPLLFGNIRMDFINNKYFNSIFYINNGNIDLYDKIHLVPFGEYFPLQKLFKPVKYYFFGDSDAFSRGTLIHAFQLKKIIFAALICYEGAYTGLVQQFMKKQPDFIAINTNDSWFGNSIGRFQHLAIATLRASETSTFIVRAAQSGISACIGPDGKLLNYLDVNEEGIFNCTISKAKFNSIFNKLQYSWLVVLILAIAYYYLKIVFQKKKIAKKGN
jgi:apolipoprotein N-acyltransferase